MDNVQVFAAQGGTDVIESDDDIPGLVESSDEEDSCLSNNRLSRQEEPVIITEQNPSEERQAVAAWTETVLLRNKINVLLRDNDRIRKEASEIRRRFYETNRQLQVSEGQVARIRNNLKESLQRARSARTAAGSRQCTDAPPRAETLPPETGLPEDTSAGNMRNQSEVLSRVLEVPSETLAGLVSQIEALHHVVDLALVNAIGSGDSKLTPSGADEASACPGSEASIEAHLAGSDTESSDGRMLCTARARRHETLEKALKDILAESHKVIESVNDFRRKNENQNANGSRDLIPPTTERHLSSYAAKPVRMPVADRKGEESFTLYQHAEQIAEQEEELSLPSSRGASDVDISMSPRSLPGEFSPRGGSPMANHLIETNTLRNLLRERQRENEHLRHKVATLRQHNRNLEMQNNWLVEAVEKQKEELADPFPALVIMLKVGAGVVANIVLMKILRGIF